MPQKLDTEESVFFYEQEFYVLSNYSSFAIQYNDQLFMTSEHLYHYHKFHANPEIQALIILARSAHDAQQIANKYKHLRNPDWDTVKEQIMTEILILKIGQHEYVKRKLLETGNRELVEDSWRDDYWGWGPNKDGRNRLGMLWMFVRYLLQRQLIQEYKPDSFKQALLKFTNTESTT